MATGYIESVYTVLDIPNITDSFVRAALPQNAPGLTHLYEEDGLHFGSLAQINSDPIPQSYAARRQFAFLDDFYFRIYLLPQALDFGAIVTTTTRDVTVWNAYFEPVTLNSIVAQIGEEVTLGGDALPYEINALTLKSWPFQVSPEGPPTLEESFVWTFSTGETFTMPVSGTRSVLWPFLPNWSDPFRVTLEYSTDIFTARSGREQRSAARADPRTSFEFAVTVNGARRQEYRRLMAYWQDRPFIVADISRNTTTEEVMLSGDTDVIVADAPSWIGQEDRAVVLVTGAGENQQIGLRVIDNIDSSNSLLTFKDSDGVDWPAGTRIYAGVVANLEDDKSLSRNTTNVMSGSVRFNVLPGTELVEAPPTAVNTLNDKELFLFKPNWGAENNNSDIHPTEYVDYQVGRIARFSPVAFPTMTWTQTFVGRDSAGIQELLDVFKRMKGRQGEFYMPTWEDDLTAKFALTGGTTGLRVEGLDTLTAYADDDTTRALMVELNDGTRLFRIIDEITDIEDDDGHDTLIQFTEQWDETVEVSEIAMISWVRCWRFATDDLTAEFLTNSVANIQMAMQTLEDLPAESEEGSNSP